MFGVISLRRIDKVCCFRNPLFLRFISVKSGEDSFTMSYLIEKCGLSQKSALQACKYVNFQTPERPDAAIKFFSDIGFTKSQLSKIVKVYPKIIYHPDPQKLFRPKIEFLKSKGLSGTELLKTICACPEILRRSLRGFIIPHFEYLKGLLGSDDKVIFAIKRYALLFCVNPQTNLEPNIAILRQHGVPESKIFWLLYKQPKSLITNPDIFKVHVDEITRMGVDPLKSTFILAVHAKTSMSKSTWEKKLDVYKKWGFTEEEVLRAFALNPWCMTISEEKLTTVMDTYVNKLGLDSSFIRKSPCIIGYSLKKRITPRAVVIQILLSKGLIDKSSVTVTAFAYTDNLFRTRILARYKDKVPNLSKLYEEQLQLGMGVPKPSQ